MKAARAVLLASPAAVLLMTGAVLLITAPDLTLVLRGSVALTAAVLGAAWLAVAGAVLLLRRRWAVATEREVAETRSAAAESHRRFVGRLDHELKNPVTALLAALAGEDADATTRAHTQAERIRRLLTDLRRISDVETAPLDRTRVQLEPVLRDAVKWVLEDAKERRPVKVDVATAPAAPVLDGDPDLILVAVYNVVANAVKYSRPDDVIEVRARQSGGSSPVVTIEVADTGPGIAEADQAVVWEELERGHPPAGVLGSGIGLALTRVIVERHDGSCELTSRPGAGTSVVLQLPSAPAQSR